MVLAFWLGNSTNPVKFEKPLNHKTWRQIKMYFEQCFFSFLLLIGWGELFLIKALSFVEFDVSILSAAAISKYNVPNTDKSGCALSGSHFASYLVIKLKVSNVGNANYEIPKHELELMDCGETNSFMNMYSFDFPGGPYYKYERCLSDTIAPKHFNCTNMGISAGNYHISTLWIEINDTVATSMTTATEPLVKNLTAIFLPLDFDLKAISSPSHIHIQ